MTRSLRSLRSKGAEILRGGHRRGEGTHRKTSFIELCHQSGGWVSSLTAIKINSLLNRTFYLQAYKYHQIPINNIVV